MDVIKKIRPLFVLFLFITRESCINATDLFEIKIDSVEICRDQNASETSRMQVSVNYSTNPRGLIMGNFTIMEDDGPIGQKFEVYKWKENAYDDIYTFNSANICGGKFLKERIHDFFIDIIQENDKCYVKKGDYKLNGVNIENIAKTLLKNDILYGRYKCHLQYYSPKQNILCIDAIINLYRIG